MKKILSTIIILATLIPNITFGAFAVPWSATSTSQGWVSPNTVNGVNFIVRAISFIASSTTSSSIFPYASTTALSADTLCLTADTCRTTWPTGGSSVGWASTTADINSIYFIGDNIGKVGIGSSSPYALLSVTNTGTNPSFIVEDSTSPDGSPFIIDASGNVGIGTASLTAKLNIEGGAVYVNNGNVTTGTVFYNKRNALFDTGSTDTVGINITGRTGQTADLFQIGSTTAVGDIFTVRANGNIGIGTTTPYAKLSVTNTSTNPSFVVEDSTSPDTTPFIIDANGNVGIGTSTIPTNVLLALDYTGTSGTWQSIANGSTGGRNYWIGSTGSGNSIGAGKLAVYDTTLGGYRTVISDSSGNMGIGTTSPYATLSVTNTGTNPSFVVEDSTSPDTTPFIIDASGNVGIGTTSPTTKFAVERVETVNRTTYNDILTISANATTNPFNGHGGGILFTGTTYQSGVNNVSYARIGSTINSNSVSTLGSNLFFDVAPLSDGVLSRAMTINYNGNVGIGTTSPYASLAITNTGTNPSFVVEDSTSPDTTPFIIDASGNVGIGTTNPGKTLDVVGNIQASGSVFSDTVESKNSGNLEFGYVNPSDYQFCLTASCATTAMVIKTTSGNVGVGTTTPSVGLTIGSGISYLCPQVLLSTSTSMTVDFNAGCNQIVRMGTSNTTISFTNGQPGQKLELTVCNPTTTSGNITFSGNMSYPGGLAPSHTTTANECDIYNFGVNYATTTAKYLLTGMQSGFK